MTDIHDLNLDDIKKFLLVNKILVSDNEMYDKAFDLMNNKSTSYKNVSISIIEWMMAHNALKMGMVTNSYDIDEIKNLSLIDRKTIAKNLGMQGDKIENILNILRYMHKLKEPIITEIPVYAVYSITGLKKILMLLKPRTREVTYTPYGLQILKLNQFKLPSYQNITYLLARSEKLISIPYVKGRSEADIERLISDEFNKKQKHEIVDINYQEYPIYTGEYGRDLPVIESLKPLLSCQKYQHTELTMYPKNTQPYNTQLLIYFEDEENDSDIGKHIFGKNKDYIISSTIGFNDILEDINNCGKVYYMISTQKGKEDFGEFSDTGHAMAIVIEPKLKLLEVYDSNGLSPDSKHVYFWVTKLSEYLIDNGIEVYRKINADEPYCPQGWSALAKEFKGEQQCLVWAY
jgi:hypothetical protein